jgi:hypothetical protein
MRKIFNEYETLTEEGSKIDRRFEQVITPLIKEYALQDYSLRDILSVIIMVSTSTINESIILRNFNIIKQGRTEFTKCEICGHYKDQWFGPGEWQCPNQEMHTDEAGYQGE